MTARAALVLVALSACSISKNAIAPPGGADGGVDSAPPDAPARDSRVRDSRPSDATSDSSPVDADAGPPRPTRITTVMDTGDQGGHPGVIWDGAEFVIGVVTSEHVELLRMPPGRIVTERERITTTPGTAIQDVVLADSGGQLAVAWTEDVADDGRLMLRLMPGDAAPREIASGVFRENDRRDALVYPTAGGFGAVYRTASAGQQLYYLEVDAGPAVYLTTVADSFGEIDAHESPLGPLFVHGNPQNLWRREGDAWVLASNHYLGAGSEGTVAPLLDGTIATVWLHADDLSTGRVLSYIRHQPDIVWTDATPPRELSVEGSDPALTTFDGGSLLAFAYPDATGRTLGLAAIDGSGNFIGGPCRVPPMLPSANDPDVACAAGWCAVVWMEASAYDASDYVTRIIQVPDDRDAFCPSG